MLKGSLIFGVGYVLGSRAGRERYGQIKELAKKAAIRLEEMGRQQQAARRSQSE